MFSSIQHLCYVTIDAALSDCSVPVDDIPSMWESEFPYYFKEGGRSAVPHYERQE